MRGLGVAVAWAALACACAPRVPGDADSSSRTQTITVGDATIRLQYLAEDEGAAREVADALLVAVPRAQRWGALRAPVTIVLHPSHDALEEAVHRDGYGWLRAWARYASIDVQSPRTWSLFGPDEQQVQELLAHELTHCVMYQAAASEWSWAYKSIPLWFREGMASVTAEQGYRRTGPEPVWKFYAAASGPGAGDGAGGSGGRAPARAKGDPLTDPDPLYQTEADLVYGTAHLAFQFLVTRYGEKRIHELLAEMGGGHQFPEAFRRATGIPVEDFEADFRRYIAWRGWRAR
jgi:hypothetical protein